MSLKLRSIINEYRLNIYVEFDSITIDDDMNMALTKILTDEYVMENGMTDKHKEEFRLYYVATTRAKFHLYNAEYIDYNNQGHEL